MTLLDKYIDWISQEKPEQPKAQASTSGNYLDNLITFVSPKWGAERKAYRSALELQASYQAAVPSRYSTPYGQSESMGSLPHLNLTVARNLRDRARSLCENNPLASSLLCRATDNIVGNGFKAQAQTIDPNWNAQADALFASWTQEADYHGRSWIQHQKIIANGYMRDGDIGSALLSKGQLQLVEGDYISSPYTKPDAFLHDGIELDKNGRTTKYWVMTYVDFRTKKWRDVPADNFVFLANKKRGVQYRGETFFAQSFDLFDQLDGYMKAAVIAQKIAACLAIFIQSKNPVPSTSGLRTTQNAQAPAAKLMKLEPGMIQTLQPGEDISQITPSQPGSNFAESIRMFIRLLGNQFGMPLEYAFMDMSGVSGSTAKASALLAQRSFESIQRTLIDEYYSHIYRWKIQQFVDEGLLEDRQDKFAHRFHAEPWPYLDGVKELQMAQLEIDIGLTSLKAANLARGNDHDRIQSERAADYELMRTKKIPIYHSSYMQEIGTKAPTSIEENVDSAPNEEVNNAN